MHMLGLSSDTCWLALLRHGATPNNLAHPPRIQGRCSDESLSDDGRKQAGCAAGALADWPVAAVYCTPLARSCETAEIVAAPHGLPVQAIEELIECDVGRWEGRTWPEIERDEPAEYARFQAHPDIYGYGGGESLSQLVARVEPAFERLLDAHRGQAIVCVAHNVVNRAWLARLLGLPLGLARTIHQHNGGINLIRRKGRRAEVVTLNNALHLERL